MPWYTSIGLYLRAVAKHWILLFLLVIGLVGDAGTVFGLNLKVPHWAWYVVTILALVTSQFRAFHDLRAQQFPLLDTYGQLRSLHGRMVQDRQNWGRDEMDAFDGEVLAVLEERPEHITRYRSEMNRASDPADIATGTAFRQQGLEAVMQVVRT